MNPVQIRQAQTEHDAWGVVVSECARNGIDLNTDKRFHAAVTAWAEELVALRSLQEARVVDRAYCEATARFDEVFGQVSA